MVERVRDFFSKFLFCIKVSCSVKTLLTLIVNSKRFSRFSNSDNQISLIYPEFPKRYLFKFNGQRRKVFLRTFSGDIGIFYEIFWRKVYNVPHLNWNDFKSIIDIGANVGMAALFFRTQAPNANIIAVEPDPDNYNLLLINTKNKTYRSVVTAVHAAVAETDGVLSYEKSRLAYNTKVTDDYNGSSVNAFSLNTLIKDYCLENVDLIKIDIEGFEHRLFERNTEWLNLVQNIIIEIHSQENFDAFLRIVTDSGFSIWKLSKGAETESIYLASRDFCLRERNGHGN